MNVTINQVQKQSERIKTMEDKIPMHVSNSHQESERHESILLAGKELATNVHPDYIFPIRNPSDVAEIELLVARVIFNFFYNFSY